MPHSDRNGADETPPLAQTDKLKKLYHGGKLEEALELSIKLLTTYPDDLLLINISGIILKRMKMFSRALPFFKKIVQLNPKNSEAHNNLGCALTDCKDFEKAENSYLKAINLKWHYPEAHNNLATLFNLRGRSEQALQKSLDTIQLDPDYAVAYNNAGNALNTLKRPLEAVVKFASAVKANPAYADAYYNLGNTFYALGKLRPAASNYKHAIRLIPGNPIFHNNLGTVLHELKQYENAAQQFHKAIRIAPDYADAWDHLGVVLCVLQKFDQALQSHDNAVMLAPGSAKTHSNRSNTLRALGRFQDALDSIDKALTLDPNFPQALVNRGNVLRDLNSPLEAIKSFEAAIKLKPDFAQAFSNLGNAFSDLGRLSEALDCYDKAIALNPDYAEAHSNRGNALRDLGRTHEARESSGKAVILNPQCVEAHQNLSIIKTYYPQDRQLQQMLRLAEETNLRVSDRMRLCFALGKALEDTQEFDKSFSYYREANLLRHQQLGYDIKPAEELVNALQRIFSREQIPNLPSKADHKTAVFILGMPRSGTSLVEQILSSHSLVYGCGELDYLNNFVPFVVSRLSASSNPDPKQFRILTAELYKTYRKALEQIDPAQPFFTDKMPLNFFWTGFILAAFPNALIIHVKRDPMATCWSIFKHFFSSNGNGYAYDQKNLAHFYLLYRKITDFWKSLFPEKIYDLCYESLTENQEQETRQIIQFCGLDWEDQCLEFHKNKRPVKTASAIQVRKKMYTGSSNAWKPYRNHLGALIKALGPLGDI